MPEFSNTIQISIYPHQVVPSIHDLDHTCIWLAGPAPIAISLSVRPKNETGSLDRSRLTGKLNGHTCGRPRGSFRLYIVCYVLIRMWHLLAEFLHSTFDSTTNHLGTHLDFFR